MINKRLKHLRQLKEVNQQEVADYLEISKAAYDRYETGAIKPPVEKISKLAEYFEVSTNFILGRTNDQTPIRNVYDDLDGDELDIQLKELLDDTRMHISLGDYSSLSPAGKKEIIDFILIQKARIERERN